MPLRILVVAMLVAGAGAAPAAAAPPANDTSAGATVIGALPYSTSVDTTEATVGADDAAIGCAIDPGTQTFTHSVWFAYTPAEDQTVAVETFGSDYTVAGAVVPADDPGSPLACFLTSTSVTLEGGTTYLIDLLQFGDAGGGTLQLTVAELIPPEVTVSGTGRLGPGGTATVQVTVGCAEYAFVDGTLTQRVGPVASVSGSVFFMPVACGEPYPVTFTPVGGRFRGGPATLSLVAGVCDPSCRFAQVEARVLLRRGP
jgi:hypothetical protein